MKKRFIAHLREKDKQEQSLCSHLGRVSVLCSQFAEKVGLTRAGRVIGLLHDIGKASAEFDRYIRSGNGLIDPDTDEYVDAQNQKGKIDHSTAGAQLIHRTLTEKGDAGRLVAQVLSLCVASHHSGLIDCLTPDGGDNFTRRMKKAKEKTHAEEVLTYLDEREMKRLENMLRHDDLIDEVINKLRLVKETADHEDTVMFKLGLIVRFLFSCLIDADRLDTADFEFPANAILRNHGKYPDWNTLIEKLNRKLSEFQNQEKPNKVDKVRNDVSERCVEFATKPKGIYQLTVPTGGGKTLSSLRFALNHAKHHQMDRVFYVIPYTSIIDQNADEVKKILEDKDKQGRQLDRIVLEHHSNLTPEEETRRQSLLSENWDAPVVFTTQVQFLEAFFGAGTRSARRMHQLANSVIIFDEVQTIPVRCVHLFNLALRFLVHSCGSTVVLCTATQPLLDKVEPAQRGLSISPDQQIVPNAPKLFRKLKRVKVLDRRRIGGWSHEEVVELASKEFNDAGSVLVIVNTRSAARSLYKLFPKQGGVAIFHLSTNMCPAHRLDVLNAVRSRLDRCEPVVCISTQLIEAGVDVDFGCVIRYLAGLDSIAQAAGRCNRNGRMSGLGKVYIVNPANENLNRLKDIQIGVEKAERVLDEYKNNPTAFDRDLLAPKAMERYYQYYFYERKSEMSYPIDENSAVARSDDLFELLSLNRQSIEAYRRTHNSESPRIPLKQSFQSAAKSFYAIDSPTRGVVVPYGAEGKQLIVDLCASQFLDKRYDLLKKAQRYSVNLFPDELRRMGADGKKAIRYVQEGFDVLYLDQQYYSNEFGWSEEIVNEMENFIIG